MLNERELPTVLTAQATGISNSDMNAYRVSEGKAE
jgi:hypothetical protein